MTADSQRAYRDRLPIRWSEATGFDKAYDHSWVKSDYSRTCSACGMSYSQWDGYPCLAKAEHVSYWIPRQP